MNSTLRNVSARAIQYLTIACCVLLFTGNRLRATFLWSNGSVNTTLSPDNRCDSGPDTCGNSGGRQWTVFDNFRNTSGTSWTVNGLDFTSFLVNGSASDYQSTQWEIFQGDPLSGGSLVASGSAVATLSNISGTCGSSSTCLESFTIDIPDTALPSGAVYYVGFSNVLTINNPGETTLRAFASGGNTAPGGSANPLAHWEQSDGSTSGVVGSAWTPGPTNSTFPNGSITETATAFDVIGTTAPEPGTFMFVGLALAGVYLVRRRVH